MTGMDATALRAWWWHRQGLDGSLDSADPGAVLARTGWARSVGGANPYLSLFARAGTSRSDADGAAARLEIYELPAARGCTYVVPAVHFGLALQVGKGAAEGELRVLDKLGVSRGEIEKLCAAVLEVLGAAGAPGGAGAPGVAGAPGASGAEQLDPARLKDALGDAVRSLGEEGRKKGQSTTLPAALGLLQSAGEIRRVPVTGRLDQQRYAYTRWTKPETGLSDEAARAELARLYFSWTGPASLANFRWFSAFSAASAKAAVADLRLVDIGDGLLTLPSLVDEVRAYRPPGKARYTLVAGIDALVLLRRDHASLLDPSDAEKTLIGEKPLVGISDLPDHAIVDRGRIVGLWQYDPGAERIVWWAFGSHVNVAALRDAVDRTEAYIIEQLGDARSFSLDSPKARAPRLAALREAAARG
jgi:hypothetical protein